MALAFLNNEHSKASLLIRGKEHTNLGLKIQNESETREYLARYLPITRGEEEAWLTKPQGTDDIVFVIAAKPHNTPIGFMGLHRIDWKNRRATTGAAISSRFWGKGYGSDAKMLLLSYAFLELGLNKIESRVLATNKRSHAYSLKCGYTEVGCLKRHHFRHGKWIDELILEVHVSKWRPLWKKFEKGEFRSRSL